MHLQYLALGVLEGSDVRRPALELRVFSAHRATVRLPSPAANDGGLSDDRAKKVTRPPRVEDSPGLPARRLARVTDGSVTR